jgi:hypothetical protein
MLCTVFHVLNYIFICLPVNSFLNFYCFFSAYIKVAHFVFIILGRACILFPRLDVIFILFDSYYAIFLYNVHFFFIARVLGMCLTCLLSNSLLTFFVRVADRSR